MPKKNNKTKKITYEKFDSSRRCRVARWNCCQFIASVLLNSEVSDDKLMAIVEAIEKHNKKIKIDYI